MESLQNSIKDNLKSINTLKNVYFDAIYLDISEVNLFIEGLYKPIPGLNRYGYRIDIPHGEQRPGNQKHMHIYVKNNELLALNIDGTAHDGYHNVEIPKKLITFLKDKGFTIPPNNLIEYVNTYEQKTLLQESSKNQINDIKQINNFAIIIANVSINKTDIICNSQVRKNSYTNINLLFNVNYTCAKFISNDIANKLTKPNIESQVIFILNDKYWSERMNVYIVWR